MSAYALWKKIVKNQVGIKSIYMVKYLYNIHGFKRRNREWEYLEGLDVILYIACQIGNLPIVMDVIRRGCNPRLSNDEPIICASKYGQLKL